MAPEPPPRPRRIGLLTPFQELPGEIGDLLAGAPQPLRHWQVVTRARDSHTLDHLRDMGADAPLLAGVERMRRWRPDVVVWACTGGSFAGGRERAVAQARTLADAAGVPATSTSLAFAAALGALGADAVTVLAPYPEPAAEAFASFLAEWGVTAVEVDHLDRPGASSSERLTAADVGPRIDGLAARGMPVLLPDTAVWGLELRAELAAGLDVPLLVANQVTLWQALALAGSGTDIAGLGELRGLTPPSTDGDAAPGAAPPPAGLG